MKGEKKIETMKAKQLKNFLIVNKSMKSKQLKNSQLGLAAAWERSGKEIAKILVWLVVISSSVRKEQQRESKNIGTAGWEYRGLRFKGDNLGILIKFSLNLNSFPLILPNLGEQKFEILRA